MSRERSIIKIIDINMWHNTDRKLNNHCTIIDVRSKSVFSNSSLSDSSRLTRLLTVTFRDAVRSLGTCRARGFLLPLVQFPVLQKHLGGVQVMQHGLHTALTQHWTKTPTYLIVTLRFPLTYHREVSVLSVLTTPRCLFLSGQITLK